MNSINLQYITFLNNDNLCSSLKLLRGFIFHCFRLTMPRMASPLLTSFKPPCSYKVFTSWNAFHTSFSTVAWTKILLRAFFCNAHKMTLIKISMITLMIIGSRALWLARSFALSCYNHRAMMITLKASSFQNGSQICWCFGVGNWSVMLLLSWIIINVIHTKTIN